MPEVYPPIEPYDCGLIDVSHGHRVYWEGRCASKAAHAAIRPTRNGRRDTRIQGDDEGSLRCNHCISFETAFASRLGDHRISVRIGNPGVGARCSACLLAIRSGRSAYGEAQGYPVARPLKRQENMVGNYSHAD